jgi:hypothetical protein
MMDWPDVGILFAQLLQHRRRTISAAVINYQHLIVVGARGQNGKRIPNQLTNGLLVVEGRKKDTYTAEALRRGCHPISN